MMDTLAHYLWAVAILWCFRKPRKWLYGLTGALPDLLSFGFVFLLEFGHINGGPPSLESIPGFVFLMYDVTHSLVIMGTVTLALYVYARDWWWLSWGWLFHIVADIPTHTRAYFPTPFLWPLSGMTVNGFSWAQPWFMALNYGALAVAFALLIWRDVRARHPARPAARRGSPRGRASLARR